MGKFEISVDSIMNNWSSVNAVLSELTIDQIESLIDYEKKHQNRKTILKRLHQRYTILNSRRERDELLRDSNN